MRLQYLWIGLAVVLFSVLAVVGIAYGCYLMAFHVKKKTADSEEYPIPAGRIYEPFREQMVKWMKEVRAMPYEAVSVTSFDGLQLHGKYYECAPGAPIELMFHGYRGSAERDLCGGIQRSFLLGRSVLLVDQRASEGSDGHVISFGINEHKDCHTWVDFMVKRFGQDVKIILTGISMGAATVMMAAGKPLPPNVIGVLADCGYSSPKAIIQKVIAQKGLPPKLAYPFVKLGARLFGHFDLEETSPVEALKHCKLPVIFFHGENDDYVPCSMSRENYEACAGPRKLVTVPGAGHGLSYLVAPEYYLQQLRIFFAPYL